jgi:predicted HTH transcriptional regulator
MKANGSPELVFEPNNDIDDYTMVTAYINEEFQMISQEEQMGQNEKENNGLLSVSDKMSDKQLFVFGCAEKLIALNGCVTTAEISQKTGIPTSTVRRYMASLCEKNLLVSEGEKKKTVYRKKITR